MSLHSADAMDIHERLKLAREEAGYKTATAAARALRIPYGTYSGHEASSRGIPRERIPEYAKKYRVRVEWLLTGAGAMKSDTVPIVGLAGAGPDGSVLFSESQGDLGETPMPPGGDENTVAVEVRGDSMHGVAENGSLVYYNNRHDPPTDDLVGRVCVVGLEDGRVLIKTLLRGRKPKHFDLYSLAAAVIADVKVAWAAPVLNVVLPYLAKQIIHRPG